MIKLKSSSLAELAHISAFAESREASLQSPTMCRKLRIEYMLTLCRASNTRKLKSAGFDVISII